MATELELVYRASEPATVHVEGDVVEGRMMPYDEWTEVRSSIEGHFMERFAPGSLAKTIAEQGHRVRALWEHGLDARLGRAAIADVSEMREEQDGAYFRASLLNGIPTLILEGIKRGLYGSSIRFRPLQVDRVKAPARSEHNPDGLEERTVREAFMKEFSITPFPQYAGATAAIRSITDEIAARQLLSDPDRLLEILRSTLEDPTPETEPEPEAPAPEDEPEDEPQHSPPTQPVGSRRTRPTRDWLNPVEEAEQWRL